MRKKITEGTILFGSVIKWVFLASIIGAAVGLFTTAFVKVLEVTTVINNHFPYYFFLLPIGFFLSSFMIRKFAPNAEGHGTEKVIEAVHKHSGRINPYVVPIKFLATFITIISGGSVGKEGPCAQMGAGLSSIFADFFKFDNRDRKKLVICGISAGFASIFGTPIAGAIFGIEVLFIGNILYDILLPSFIAGIVGYQVAASLGVQHFYYHITFIPLLTGYFFVKLVLAGVFFGLCSILLIEGLRLGKRLSMIIQLSEPLKALIAGIFLIGLTFIFSKQYLGLGTGTIQDALNGVQIVWYAFILKIIFTSISLHFGGSGGVVTPIFFVGATTGVLFSRFFGLDVSVFSAIGLVSLLAGAANTPIAAIIMAVELFGSKMIPYVAVACIISFLITGHRSVYPSQVLVIKKSAAISVDMDKEIETVSNHFRPQESILKRVLNFCKGFR